MAIEQTTRKTYRSFRPVVVPEHLSDLHAQRVGVVTLPINLDWQPSKSYDLTDIYFERQFYQTVLEEAPNTQLMGDYLNAQRLVELWPTLWLSPVLRDAWEKRFPELHRQ